MKKKFKFSNVPGIFLFITFDKLYSSLVSWLVGFYGTSTFLGYLTPNPFLYKLSVLFQTIQFRMSTQFDCQKHFYFKLFGLVKQF